MLPSRPPAPLQAFRRAGASARAAVHPTPAIRHRRPLTRRAAPSASAAPRGRREIAAHRAILEPPTVSRGLSATRGLHRLVLTLPPAPPAPLDTPRHHGLSALADGDVLHDDVLLPAGLHPLQRDAPALRHVKEARRRIGETR